MFRAHEPGRDRLVAVKVFHLDLTPEQSSALVAQFDELIGANIRHPGIAAPVAAGLDHGAPYLAHEFVVGDSLDVVLRERGPMSIEEVVPLVDSLAAAIDHAASRGVSHLALHMRDIILSSQGARMTGFGIAAALSKVSAKLPSRPQYAAPDGPSDVYALAAVAFEAISGKRPSPDTLRAFEAAQGAELRGAFAVALAPRRELRPARAGDFADVLRDAAGMTAEAAPDLDLRIDRPSDLMANTSDEVITPIPPLIRVDHPAPDRRWPIVAMFLVFGIVTALAVAFFLRTPTPSATSESAPAVKETTVDLPASAPGASVEKPASTPPAAQRPAPARDAPPAGSVAGAVKPARGSLLIRSTPGDADVLVNGKPIGTTPVAVRDLELGSYTIRVTRNGYVPEEQKLELTEGRPTASTIVTLRQADARGAEGAGRLVVQSRPSGARVFVNDRLVGSTPLSMADVPAGSARVRIELDGYRPWITAVRVSSGDRARVAASLERR